MSSTSFDPIKRILLVALSVDAGKSTIEEGLARFHGEVYIAIGEDDEAVWKASYECDGSC